jgi:glycosyltransferase involved in cell wall biosynthesis
MMNLINGIHRAGIEVHVLLSSGDYPELRSALDGIRIHKRKLGKGSQAIEVLQDVIREIAPDAVLSNRDDDNARVVEAGRGMKEGPRIVLRVGINIPEKLQHQNILSRWRRRRKLLATYRGADLLIGISKGVTKGLTDFLGRDASPVRTIYNPLDLALSRRLAQEPPNHPWFAERDFPLLVSVGRLARMKDQATMLHALKRLPSDVRLVIFGEGRQRGALLELAAKLGLKGRFDLPGHTDNPFAHVARADLFVLSSRFEGLCNALVEALAVGTPAVATDCPSGPYEILGGGRYGRLVPIGDFEVLSDAISVSLSKPRDKALLDEAVERFDLERAVSHYIHALGLRPDFKARH